MNKIRKWIEPTKNKIIAGICAVVLVSACGFGIYALSNKPEPVIVFKDNIELEYGSTDNDVEYFIDTDNSN